MKTKRKDSIQAVKDKANFLVLQNDNSSLRDKERAFNEFYSRHNNQIRVFFLKNLRDSDVAEDLLMITFQKVHENIDLYDSQYAVSTWMYNIARNSLIDFTRKAKFEVLSLDALSVKTSEDNDGMDFQIDSGVANPEQKIIKSEVIAEIHNAVNSLKSGKVRDLMICRYIKELSYEETAKELKLELNSTMRTSVQRGKNALREKLQHLREFA